MANFEKLKSGKVRVSIYVNGHRDSKTLVASKAKSWAREREVELSRLSKIDDDTRSFEDLVKRYSREISPKKRGCKWEQKRLARFDSSSHILDEADHYLSKIKLKDLTRLHLEEWVGNRLEKVKSSTVNRELNLISNCMTFARVWQWMAHNPMKDLQRPKNPAPRNRRISRKETEMICHAADFIEGAPLCKKSHFVAVAFLFAIETAMRAGEICSLEPTSINFETRVARLDKTKNGDEREVPLSRRAIELLKLLPDTPDGNGRIFHLTPETLDINFRKIKRKTLVEDLHFHDTRHEATTQMAKLPSMNVLRLARITGHKDLKYLMVYFNETAEEMVAALDEKPKEQHSSQTCTNNQLLKELIKTVAAELAPAHTSTVATI